ncbi:MAG: type I-B CRISPR-associated protein Cas8b1/Cst1, partial [Bellilinea sp.]
MEFNLDYTGHPFYDVGLATLTAFARKRRPADLQPQDLQAAAEYMQKNYTVNPLKSFLTVAFPNSGFTQPAYEKQPEKRHAYARSVLFAFNAEPAAETDPLSGLPAANARYDVKGELPPGRAFRQHIPLLTGEEVVNFFPYGDAGLPLSGLTLLAVQALPLGCAKVAGRLLAVHSDSPELL